MRMKTKSLTVYLAYTDIKENFSLAATPKDKRYIKVWQWGKW